MSIATKLQVAIVEREVSIPVNGVTLRGTLAIPRNAMGIVLFVHGSGSSRHSPRNRFVAGALQAEGIATLLFDLLTREEEMVDQRTAELRFDIHLLTKRLIGATKWVTQNPETRQLKVGYFGASTGAAAALVAAAELRQTVGAVVSRGGRPDLAGDALGMVRAPTLLIVGGNDGVVIELNRRAESKLRDAVRKLVIIPGATHLFEESGALEEVAATAGRWFHEYLTPPPIAPTLRGMHARWFHRGDKQKAAAHESFE
jgi:putative phosphoribosyl transferase